MTTTLVRPRTTTEYTLCYCVDTHHGAADHESTWRDNLDVVTSDALNYSPTAHIIRRVIRVDVIQAAEVTP